MIELRYTLIKGQETLQYRTWIVRIDASGAITPLPLPIEWSEWITVPKEWIKLPSGGRLRVKE